MHQSKSTGQRGFTIVEVVLVLAIAGLIFLMVFIALPALQRNQRDSQRRSDLNRMLSAVQNFQTNYRNRLPDDGEGEWNTLITSYLKAGGDNFDDPGRGEYEIIVGGDPESDFDPEKAVIYVTPGMVCDGEGLVAAGSQKVALRIRLEGGGITCVSNN